MPGRDNGFVARHYVPLADLDPRLADAMLDVLRAEGIAAYVEPSTGRVGGYLEIYPHEVPRDRLWVDRERHDRAVVLLNAHTDAREVAGPTTLAGREPTSTDGSPDDDVWAQLVANFDMPAADPVPRWPVAEDLPSPPAAPADADADADDHGVDGQQTLPLDGPENTSAPGYPVRRRIVRPAEPAPDPTPSAAVRPQRPQLPDDAVAPSYDSYDPLSVLDEHFVPPPPPPAPALRPVTKWAIVSIVIGIGVLASQAFTDVVPDAMVLGTLGIVGGFVTLVAGMRTDRPDDGSDDGAVV